MEPRIGLGAAELSDIDFIADIKTNAALWLYETDISADREQMRRTVAGRLGGGEYYQFVVRLADGNAAIGEVHLRKYEPERKSWELGYCLLPAFRGRGYCAEAVLAALEFAFETLGAHKVVAMCHAQNIASRRVAERAGMTLEGVFREELPWRGGWADQLFFSILDREYRARG